MAKRIVGMLVLMDIPKGQVAVTPVAVVMPEARETHENEIPTL
jgi:hypothetical protein